MYYMGLYFTLNDSSDRALVCYRNSISAARKKGDYYTQYLSLFQLSVILREYNVSKAIDCAKAAISSYNHVKTATLSNKAYSLLNLAECISYGSGNPDSCISLAKTAVKYAEESKDSMTISDAYQDLAVFYNLNESYDLALKASLTSNQYNIVHDFSKTFALASHYAYADSLSRAKQILSQVSPSNIDDTCALFSLKRVIAIHEHNWADVESFADSTEYYLDKKNSENLKARNNYYSLMLQKEIAQARLSGESQWKSHFIILMGVAAFIIIALLSYISLQKRRHMLEKMEHKDKLHQIEIDHKEKQITTMSEALLRKIDIVQRLQAIKLSDRKQVILTEEDWKEIEVFLNCTNDKFVERLKSEFPQLTQKDIKFLMLVKLRIPYQSIAIIYGIEEKSVKQRLFLLKNKLRLNKGEMSTREFIERY